MQLELTFVDRTPSRSCAAVTLGVWAASTLVSIAVSQIFLLVSGAFFIFGWLRKLHPICLPPILLPVSAFVITTLMSLVLSPDPAQGTPSIRKLVLFLSILLVASVFRNSTEIARVFTGIVTISAMAALLSFWQLAENLRTVSTMKRTYGLNAPEAYSYFIYGRR